MKINKNIIPADTPSSSLDEIEKASQEISAVLASHGMNTTDFMILMCALFDASFGNRSVEAMNTCAAYMQVMAEIDKQIGEGASDV